MSFPLPVSHDFGLERDSNKPFGVRISDIPTSRTNLLNICVEKFKIIETQEKFRNSMFKKKKSV